MLSAICDWRQWKSAPTAYHDERPQTTVVVEEPGTVRGDSDNENDHRQQPHTERKDTLWTDEVRPELAQNTAEPLEDILRGTSVWVDPCWR